MSHLELIIPFGIPPASLAKDLLKEMHTPGLARLIASAGKAKVQAIDDFSRALSYEYWLASQFPPGDKANSPPLAWNRMKACGLTPEAGYWFLLQPVHIHIARDHLVLTDQRRLHIGEAESRVLFEQAKASCEEIGLQLLFGDAQNWFLRADAWPELQTATVDAACGHNIDIWMPKGEFERAWRKLQNEIQMQWFTHDINAQREMRGAKVINSVWISGGAQSLHPEMKQISEATDYAQHLAQSPAGNKHAPALLGNLSEAAINNDWALWLDNIHVLEKKWFSPLLTGLRNKQVSSLKLHFSDGHRIASFDVTPWSLRKFWVKPSLHHLFSIS
ncbi:hypothetical protein UNDYM_2429 [Undibacterium sp. YM2]|uniref:hypothetical protein n=1 Tax=Undibacterium sp. YM2 TaxID=2058625 RepID=UPI001331EF07|nr:hypothetical protein [Undibacterium sp. YM2]BBB66682.1 hypothetical protein UNDYM_2429 [Undibacterium sp. YM2]